MGDIEILEDEIFMEIMFYFSNLDDLVRSRNESNSKFYSIILNCLIFWKKKIIRQK